MWEIPKIWEGGQCIILGGGPSFPRQFGVPELLIQDVLEHRVHASAYAPYFAPLHSQHVIAVNMAYRLGSWIDCVFYGDHNFLKDHQREFFEFKGLRVSGSIHRSEYADRLKYVARDPDKKKGISFRPNHIAWNGNSGGAAINLAYHFGVKRILLFGFDMKLDENKNQHWHKYYAGDPRTIQSVFDRQSSCFPVIAQDLLGIVEVINCNPDSAITAFPRIDFTPSLL